MSMNARNKFRDSDLAAAGLQAFFNLSALWNLDTTEQKRLLGMPPDSTFFKWKRDQKASRLSRDVLERISYLLGIHKALNILLPDAKAANEWVHRPNTAPMFNGQTALDKMLAGSIVDLADVRRYLDAERG